MLGKEEGLQLKDELVWTNVFECFASMYVCMPQTYLLLTKIRRGLLDALELESQMFVSHVGVGNWNQFVCNSSKCS